MRAVVQRVSEAHIEVEGRTVGSIEAGLLIYLGVGKEDTEADAAWLAEKVANLRIFMDAEGKMNHSLLDRGESALIVSQFTLYADARKGRRPGYSDAADPAIAQKLYERFVELMAAQGITVATGVFQAVMRVTYTNEGPITILLDTKKQF